MEIKKYKVIYADPAWQFKNKHTGGSMKSAAGQKYTTTSIEDMKKLRVSEICDDDCILFMWWVGSMPDEAISLCRAWGFKFCTMTGFVWDKLTTNGKPFFGMGHTTRASVECCLIGYKGKLKNLIIDKSVRSRISAKVGKHSEKPNEFRLAIEKMCGDIPRIELFARERFAGWDVWGNEVKSDVEI